MATVSLPPSSSSSARAVTVCAVAQVLVVNVSVRACGLASLSTASAASGLVAVTVTVSVGCVARRTVYCADWFSVTASGPASMSFGVLGSASITMPRGSLSSTATCTLGSAPPVSPVYVDAPDAACVTVAVSSVALSSSTALAVTVCGAFQLDALNVSVRACGVESASSATAASLLVAVTVTMPRGSVFSRTV